MKTKAREGRFQVIDCFVVRRRNEFYLLGQIIEGAVKEQSFINIPLNSELSLTLRISKIEEVEIASEKDKYTLLIVTGNDEDLDLFLALNIGSESLDITITGKD